MSGSKPGRGVGDAVGRARPLLQLRVVRRHDREPRLRREPREQRLRERRSLDRIGAGGELVDEHERPLPCRVEDRDEVGNVAGEGREAHLDRLPVADVGEHLVEDGQRGRLRRRAQAGLVEERGEAERLQRHRLAARVRAADHERRAATPARGRSAPPPQDRAAGAALRPAAPRPRSPPARRANPARRSRARARGRSRPTASTRATTASARSPTAPRELAQDPLDLLALRGGRLRRGGC